jgi:hypothetical protein
MRRDHKDPLSCSAKIAPLGQPYQASGTVGAAAADSRIIDSEISLTLHPFFDCIYESAARSAPAYLSPARVLTNITAQSGAKSHLGRGPRLIVSQTACDLDRVPGSGHSHS